MADEAMDLGGAGTSIAAGTAQGAMAGSAFGPWGTVIGAGVGFGLSAFGAYESYSGSKKQADISQQQAQANMVIAQKEMQQDALRRRAMELDASRRSLEALRSAQKARSLAITNANNQGGLLGSGLVGGLSQVSAQGNWNIQGIHQNLQLGESMFDLSGQISQQRMLLAQLGSQSASAQSQQSTGQGLSSLGSSISSNLGQINRLSGGFNAPQTPSGPPGGYGVSGASGLY